MRQETRGFSNKLRTIETSIIESLKSRADLVWPYDGAERRVMERSYTSFLFVKLGVGSDCKEFGGVLADNLVDGSVVAGNIYAAKAGPLTT